MTRVLDGLVLLVLLLLLGQNLTVEAHEAATFESSKMLRDGTESIVERTTRSNDELNAAASVLSSKIRFADKLQRDADAFVSDVKDWIVDLVGERANSEVVVASEFTLSTKGEFDVHTPCGDLTASKTFAVVKAFLDSPKYAALDDTMAESIMWHPSKACLSRKNSVEVDGGSHVEFVATCDGAVLLNVTSASGGLTKTVNFRTVETTGAFIGVDYLDGSVRAVGATGRLISNLKLRFIPDKVDRILKFWNARVRECAATNAFSIVGVVGGGWRQKYSKYGGLTGAYDTALLGYAEAFEIRFGALEIPTVPPLTTTPTTRSPEPVETQAPTTKTPEPVETPAPTTKTPEPAETPAPGPVVSPAPSSEGSTSAELPTESPEMKEPTAEPTTIPPTDASTEQPTSAPTSEPTEQPTSAPTDEPTDSPSVKPSDEPTEGEPTGDSTTAPTREPTATPTDAPTQEPSEAPTNEPTEAPVIDPTVEPADQPTETPPDEQTSGLPTESPSKKPAEEPTEAPTENPSDVSSEQPTETPTETPSKKPTEEPTESPSESPSEEPIESPSESPNKEPMEIPSEEPREEPTEDPVSDEPTEEPSQQPTEPQSEEPTEPPSTESPTTPTPADSAPQQTSVFEPERADPELSVSSQTAVDVARSDLKVLSDSTASQYLESGVECAEKPFDDGCFMNAAMGKVLHGSFSSVSLDMNTKTETPSETSSAHHLLAPILVLALLGAVLAATRSKRRRRRRGYAAIPGEIEAITAGAI